MAKPRRVGHLVLNVKDVEACTKFYTDVLGFDIAVQRPDGSATFLTCGEMHHDVALFKAPVGAERGELGLNHFAVEMENQEALSEFYHRLKDKGVPIDRTTDHGMTGSVYFSDPEGNRIEYYYNMFENPADGLAEMRRPGRQNKVLALD